MMNAVEPLLRFINTAPKNIAQRCHSEYFGIFLSCISGILINIVGGAFFAYALMPTLTLLSAAAIVKWCISGCFARKGHFTFAVYFGLVGMTIHIAILVWLIGTDYGTQMILWTAIAMATLNTSQRPWVTNAFGLFVVAELVLIYALYPEQTSLRPFEGNENLFFIMISLMTGAPLMFVMLRLKSMASKQQKRLQKQIYNDELTGLYNRHFVYELLAYELEMMEKVRSPFCLCFADVDYFKKVNDTYGHQVGDEVLVEVAQTLVESFRKSDVICRWGGEEFVIVLPRCNIEQAPSVIEKVKSMLSKKTLSSKQLNVTMSYGIVRLSNEEPLEATLKRADDLLYLAKKNGRNRIEIESAPVKT